jgi:hypothetical protein
MLPFTALAGAAAPSDDADDGDDTLKASSANAVPDKVTNAHSDKTTDDIFTIFSFGGPVEPGLVTK